VKDIVTPTPEEDVVLSLADLINSGNYGNDPLVDFTDVEGFEWTDEEKQIVRQGAWRVASDLAGFINQPYEEMVRLSSKLGEELGEGFEYTPVTARDAFLAVYGSTVLFNKTGVTRTNLGKAVVRDGEYVVDINEHDLVTVTSETTGTMWVAHELGHVFNYALYPNTTDDSAYGQGIIDLALNPVFVDINEDGIIDDDEFISGNTTWNSTKSYTDDTQYRRKDDGYQPGLYQDIDERYIGPYKQSPDRTVSEDFADMYMNWVFDSFEDNRFGNARDDWEDRHMTAWLYLAVTNNRND